MCATATATYEDNFPHAETITDQLENINPRKLRRTIGDIDLLLASPECTNHTCAKGSAPRSESSRATALQALRFAKEFRPRWMILENVVHMRPWSRYGELKDCIRDLGYNLAEQILDASEFGVPQTRRRLFIVCDREQTVAPTPSPKNRKPRTAQEILDQPGTWQTTPLYAPTRAKATLERAERAFARLGKHASFLLVYYGTDGSGGWQPLDRPLRTITTVDRFALVEPPNNGEHEHQMRMLQVAELRRAMGFKRDFVMKYGTRRDKIRILGNGVCPPVIEAIIKRLGSD